jgi:hypothetical protein
MFLLVCCLLLLAGLFCAAWYALAVHRNRRRAVQVLRWIELALAGQGQAAGVCWIAHSRFKVPLRLTCGVFQRASMLVHLIPREMPLRWLLSKLSGEREVLVFQADLDVPPAVSLQVHNFRWVASSSRSPQRRRSFAACEHSGPFVVSTRKDWQKEISLTMSSLTKGDNREFLDISFQRRSPHFSATLPVEAIAPGSPMRASMFETMRELAVSSSTSRS